MAIYNSTQHLESPKNLNRRAASGRSAIKKLVWVRGEGKTITNLRSTNHRHSSALAPQTLSCSICGEGWEKVGETSRRFLVNNCIIFIFEMLAAAIKVCLLNMTIRRTYMQNKISQICSKPVFILLREIFVCLA